MFIVALDDDDDDDDDDDSEDDDDDDDDDEVSPAKPECRCSLLRFGKQTLCQPEIASGLCVL